MPVAQLICVRYNCFNEKNSSQFNHKKSETKAVYTKFKLEYFSRFLIYNIGDRIAIFLIKEKNTKSKEREAVILSALGGGEGGCTGGIPA